MWELFKTHNLAHDRCSNNSWWISLSSLTPQLHAIEAEISPNISPESTTVKRHQRVFSCRKKKLACTPVLHPIAFIIQKQMNNFRLDSAHMELRDTKQISAHIIVLLGEWQRL